MNGHRGAGGSLIGIAAGLMAEQLGISLPKILVVIVLVAIGLPLLVLGKPKDW